MSLSYYLHQASVFIAKDPSSSTAHLRDHQLKLCEAYVLQIDQTESTSVTGYTSMLWHMVRTTKADIQYMLAHCTEQGGKHGLRHSSELDILMPLKELESTLFKLGSNSSLNYSCCLHPCIPH